MNYKPKILIDCDPGADDTIALMWAMILHKKGLCEIVAITTAAGNLNSEVTFNNANRIAHALGVNVPIGYSKEKNNKIDASYIHGKDGIGGASIYLPHKPAKKEFESEDLILKMLKKYPNELEILEFGPMTKLSNVEKKHPGALSSAKRIIAMGGAFFVHGNVTPHAEFNIFFNHKAAKEVFNSKANIVIVPLDVTLKTQFRVKDLEEITKNITNKQMYDFITTLIENTIKSNMEFRETRDAISFAVHDASTVAFLFYPHLYSGKVCNVKIETKGEYTSGATLIDSRNIPNATINSLVLLDIDKVGFLEAMTEDMKDLNLYINNFSSLST